jgi:hypothetical protein
VKAARIDDEDAAGLEVRIIHRARADLPPLIIEQPRSPLIVIYDIAKANVLDTMHARVLPGKLVPVLCVRTPAGDAPRPMRQRPIPGVFALRP